MRTMRVVYVYESCGEEVEWETREGTKVGSDV